MKKVFYLLRFLNKKGAFVLGAVIGAVLALLLCGVSVFADDYDYDIYADDDSLYCICSLTFGDDATILDTSSYNSYEAVYSGYPDYIEHIGCYYNDYGDLVIMYDRSSSSYSKIYRVLCSKGSDQYSCYAYNLSVTVPSQYSGAVNVYIFNTYDELTAYFNGELDASEALNYEEVNNRIIDEIYTSDIPYPDSVYFSTLGSDYVVSNWDYNDNKELFYSYTEENTIYYDVTVRHFYCTSGFIQRLFDNEASAYNAISKLGANNIDSMGRLVCDETVSEYEENHISGTILQTLLDEDGIPYTVSDIMRVKNQTSTVPEKYSLTVKFNYQYVGSEISVTPYIIVDHVKYYGNTVVSRKFTADDLNSTLGSTQSVIAKDENGDEYLADQSKIEDDGTKWDNILTDLDGTLNSGGVMNYISTGFGLSGTGGFIEMSRRFFLGVPAYIWALIAMAMSVNIIVIVFKVIRGM